MNNKNTYIWNGLTIEKDLKSYGLQNQILFVGKEKPIIGNIEEISYEGSIVNRSCDINDFFKSYTCLFTNILAYKEINALEQFENGIVYAVIQKNDQEIIFKIQQGRLIQEEQQIIKNKNKQKQETSFEKVSQIIAQMKKEYKDQITNVGKIIQFKHPQILTISFVFPQQQQNAIQPYINNQIMEDEFEFISYHQSEKNTIDILNSHINDLMNALKSNQKQILYFNDRNIFPINKFTTQESIFFSSDFQPNRRLLTYQNKLKNILYEENGKLFNVHHYITPKSIENGQRFLIRGDYGFHHYMQDGFDDKGWGCAYRSFQSVLSWLMENGYTEKKEIPNHRKIQQLLVEMNDKPFEFVGSQEWIGAFEVNMLIEKLTKIECKILNIQKGTDIIQKLPEFRSYFENKGAPIMFGGGQYAYTLLGIEYNDDECRFLILDPHYTANDTIKSVIEKQGVSWKKADLFEEKYFYNFCMPLIQ